MVNRRRHGRLRRRRNRVFRPRFSLDSLSDEECKQRFRFSKHSIVYILNLIRVNLVVTGRSRAVTPLLQLLVALRFFATGAFFRLIGDSVGLSEATVCRCVHRVAAALAGLAPRFIKFPTAATMRQTQQDFYRLCRFPNVVGAIDGTQIRVQAPVKNEQDFVNRKGYHSINVQMTCDANFKITSCVADWPGSVHDARVFRNSGLCTNFESGRYDGILLGDSAYPCRRFLMTPFLNPESEKKTRFNRALCRGRVTIEQTFGMMKRRFYCLHSGLRVEPAKVATIVMACGVLYNIAMDAKEPLDEGHVPEDDQDVIFEIEGQDGKAYRNYICNQYF